MTDFDDDHTACAMPGKDWQAGFSAGMRVGEDKAKSEARDAARIAALSAPAGCVVDVRAQFEAWATKRWGCATDKWADSENYKYSDTRQWWECWKAALAAAPAVSGAGVVEAHLLGANKRLAGALEAMEGLLDKIRGEIIQHASDNVESWDTLALIREIDAINPPPATVSGAVDRKALIARAAEIAKALPPGTYSEELSTLIRQIKADPTPPAAVSDPVAEVADDLEHDWASLALIEQGRAHAAQRLAEAMAGLLRRWMCGDVDADTNLYAETDALLTGQATPEGSS